MKPIIYTATGTIPATVERVFEVLTDPHQMARWLPAARAVEASAPLRMGSRFRVLYDTRDTEVEVIDFHVNESFGWIERVGRKNWKTFFRLDFAGASTNLTVQQVWLPPSRFASLKVKLQPARNVPARMNTMIQNLRTAVSK